ncbi:MAG: hypothetical protein ABSA93_02825 [Streptosporangiaceae bacterium]|jgi:hypothetical protein
MAELKVATHTYPGITTGRLRRNFSGVLISTVAWRNRAMAGVRHSGSLVSGPRSDDRTRA